MYAIAEWIRAGRGIGVNSDCGVTGILHVSEDIGVNCSDCGVTGTLHGVSVDTGVNSGCGDTGILHGISEDIEDTAWRLGSGDD